MNATLAILLAADAQIELDEIEVGEQVYLAGNMSGISTESWDVIRRNRVFLEAPITTPQGRLQKPQRHDSENAGALRRYPALHEPASVC